MKKWRMQFQAVTQVEVEADNYSEAIQKGTDLVMENSINEDLNWTNIKALSKTIEMVEK